LRINCYVHYATFAPAQLLQISQKRRDFDSCLRIALGNLNEHADAPHPLGLLRARRERPRGRSRPMVIGMWPLSVRGLPSESKDTSSILRQVRCHRFRRLHRRRVLRMCCKRPCRSHASKQADELAL